MPTERCAKLMAVSMANNLDEVWIADHPVLLNCYLNQYFPNLCRWYVWITRSMSLQLLKELQDLPFLYREFLSGT